MNIHDEINKIARECHKAANREGEVFFVTYSDGNKYAIMAKNYSPDKHGSIERVIRPRDYEPPSLNEW